MGFLEVEDGRIAYAAVGDGPTLVMPAWWVSHLVEDWNGRAFRGFVEAIADRYCVVRYDRLGTGVSDRVRPPETMTHEYEVGVLEALIDHLDADRVTLVGISCGACTSAAYAARHPERVERIVFYGGYAYGGELGPPAALAAMVDMVRSAWGLGSRMLVDVFAPSMSTADRQAVAALQRASSSPAMAAELLSLVYRYDVRDALPGVSAPTLVVHRDRDRAVPCRCGREVAGIVPHAELVTLEGDAHLPWHGDARSVIGALSPFLGVAGPAPAPAAAEGIEELSSRERDVLRLVAEGLTDAEIAERLVLSPHTVHRHVANIRRKLGAHSRSAAAVAATRAGLI
jgi:pimeloyl-ACP methyl ester carboxylesterase/DNA-binding CsgD family transcriptional regulator